MSARKRVAGSGFEVKLQQPDACRVSSSMVAREAQFTANFRGTRTAGVTDSAPRDVGFFCCADSEQSRTIVSIVQHLGGYSTRN